MVAIIDCTVLYNLWSENTDEMSHTFFLLKACPKCYTEVLLAV